MTERVGRRQALAAIGTGLAVGFAGCGYQPGAGELEWTERLSSSALPGDAGSRRWFAADGRLVSIQNRSGRAFDHESGTFGTVEDAQVTVVTSSGESASVSTETQYGGEPAVTADGVYLPLEDGGLTALEWPGRAESGADAANDDVERWTVDREGEPFDLVAGDDLLVGTLDAAVFGFDPATGEEVFTLESESDAFDDGSSIAVHESGVWFATGGAEPTLYRIDGNGLEQVSRSLPSEAAWLEATADHLLVGLADGAEVWGVDEDGEREFSFEFDDPGTVREPPVLVGTRLYLHSSEELLAVDAGRRQHEWTLESPFSGEFVADEEGLYGRRRGPGGEGCALVEVTPAGEEDWTAALPDEVGCSGELFLLEDRLVVVDGSDLYGFRRDPGRRLTLT